MFPVPKHVRRGPVPSREQELREEHGEGGTRAPGRGDGWGLRDGGPGGLVPPTRPPSQSLPPTCSPHEPGAQRSPLLCGPKRQASEVTRKTGSREAALALRCDLVTLRLGIAMETGTKLPPRELKSWDTEAWGWGEGRETAPPGGHTAPSGARPPPNGQAGETGSLGAPSDVTEGKV